MSQSASPRPSVSAWLWAECLGLFLALPVALYFLRLSLAYRIVPLVLLAAAGAACYLWLAKGFDRRAVWRVEGLGRQIRQILLVLAILGLPLALASRHLLGERFLAFPSTQPGIWLLVMALYPLLAAYPQELIFRAFFFHRYRALFPGPWGMLLASSVAFGLAHLLYGNLVAPALTTLGGLLFGYRYQRSGSVVAAGLEHGLWGDLLYTLGLGWFFYSGSIS